MNEFSMIQLNNKKFSQLIRRDLIDKTLFVFQNGIKNILVQIFDCTIRECFVYPKCLNQNLKIFVDLQLKINISAINEK